MGIPERVEELESKVAVLESGAASLQALLDAVEADVATRAAEGSALINTVRLLVQWMGRHTIKSDEAKALLVQLNAEWPD